ncbi:aminopeptidase P family protein [Cocleimonas sp. KMM 6892]|uniref:aminopeptidase P family protein n=1 Tax=unclassified Cocleimonas TaxID=2639732 RepID=UPI002DBFFF8A|nr:MULTISPECIES: aminopeptidase P family protein [unclassified Cocleimonas]MEB8433812.1 aminopeptidase P family protein [Cocleimonas sp. KMM 6892]MEC4716623.1 aminopeptidase P family protein [Cocleimonas sp. KMM 6895]MEC4746222.1 aminopeptidase P family protein [Cocleimonas sp. KMM 6896]
MNKNATLNMPSYINIPNGEAVNPTFSKQEMQSRVDKLRVLMSTLNIDSCLMTSIHNINYYSDFLYCSFGRKYGLVINHDTQITVTANIDGGQPYRRTFGENLVYTDWQNDNFYKASASLIKGKQRVGIEFDQVPLEMLEKLKLAMPESEFVDISAGAMKLRMIKSTEEIAHITKMTAIADIGGAACVEAIGVGVPEHEVALHSTQTMVREIAKVFPDGELLDTWTWFQSGMNTDGAHNPVTSKKIESGDILSLNCFPMVAGYYVALERTLFAESASDEHLRMWEVNCKVHDEGKKLIVPGARCCDIAYALNEIYAEHDLLQYRTFGYGHSFGVLCHYYGREAGLELREEVETVLEKDMVVSMEPMIMLPEGMPGAGGYREHDILVLTDDGANNITGFPYGPEHNII